MEALAAFAGIIGAAVAQWFNRYKSNNTALLKVALIFVGLACYALGNGLPEAWYGPKLLTWLQPAWLWAAAVPGIASLLGAVPTMQTNSK